MARGFTWAGWRWAKDRGCRENSKRRPTGWERMGEGQHPSGVTQTPTTTPMYQGKNASYLPPYSDLSTLRQYYVRSPEQTSQPHMERGEIARSPSPRAKTPQLSVSEGPGIFLQPVKLDHHALAPVDPPSLGCARNANGKVVALEPDETAQPKRENGRSVERIPDFISSNFKTDDLMEVSTWISPSLDNILPYITPCLASSNQIEVLKDPFRHPIVRSTLLLDLVAHSYNPKLRNVLIKCCAMTPALRGYLRSDAGEYNWYSLSMAEFDI